MSERTSYTPGTPCWVELGTPDIEATAGFYGGLLGWEVPEQPNSAELGGYRRALLRGKSVAGVAPLMQEGQPPAWTNYVSVADAAATIAAAREAGGQVHVEPMDVVGLGTMALFADPTGAFCGIWQPGMFPGAELVNEYGCFGWNELNTRDTSAAREFYGAVFGWEVEERDMGEMTYYVWKLGEASVGGMADITGRVPDEVPAHWLVYFSVDNADGAVEKVKAAGGAVSFGPIDIPVGRFAVVSDQFGAVFAVMQPSEETLSTAP
jgi:predicted enzyme related to lactoylglutathione lyase